MLTWHFITLHPLPCIQANHNNQQSKNQMPEKNFYYLKPHRDLTERVQPRSGWKTDRKREVTAGKENKTTVFYSPSSSFHLNHLDMAKPLPSSSHHSLKKHRHQKLQPSESTTIPHSMTDSGYTPTPSLPPTRPSLTNGILTQ